MTDAQTFDAEQLTTMLTQREWREGYLAERMQDEILLEQILIETEGEQVGQINALSVVEFPGIRVRLANLHVSAALCTSAMANLTTLSVKRNWAATFMQKA
jgi:predicted ATP-dependent protease